MIERALIILLIGAALVAALSGMDPLAPLERAIIEHMPLPVECRDAGWSAEACRLAD